MSNHLVIASVSAVLRQLLHSAVRAEVSTASVKVGRPEAPASGSASAVVHLFLYQVSPSPNLRNDELPTRRSDGTVASRPRLPLDLHYLLCCYGDASTYEPERLMGAALRALHGTPVLTRDVVSTALALEVASDPDHPLAGSDLVDQVERVVLTPEALNLEALSKLWSVFFQTPYALSVGWEASVALLDGLAPARPALPVLSRSVVALPRPALTLDAVEAGSGRNDPIDASSAIVLRGQGFSGGRIGVRIGGQSFSADRVTGTRLDLDLSAIPSASLRAGVVPVTVSRVPLDEGGAPLRWSFESNAVPLVLRPVVTVSAASAAEISLDVRPQVGQNQRVSLNLFNGIDSFSFEAPARDTDVSRVTFNLGGAVPAGTWLYQLQVDGARSLVTSSGAGFDAPTVVI